MVAIYEETYDSNYDTDMVTLCLLECFITCVYHHVDTASIIHFIMLFIISFIIYLYTCIPVCLYTCICVYLNTFIHVYLYFCSWPCRPVGELPPPGSFGEWDLQARRGFGAASTLGSRGRSAGSWGRPVGEMGPQAQRGVRPAARQLGPTDTYKNNRLGPQASECTHWGVRAAGSSGSWWPQARRGGGGCRLLRKWARRRVGEIGPSARRAPRPGSQTKMVELQCSLKFYFGSPSQHANHDGGQRGQGALRFGFNFLEPKRRAPTSRSQTEMVELQCSWKSSSVTRASLNTQTKKEVKGAK